MAVIEVVDRDIAAPARVERRERGGPTGFVRKTGAGRPEQRCRCDRPEVEIVARDVHVGRFRLPIEVHREPVRRKDLAEDERGRKRGVGPDPSRVDPEFGEGAPDVHPEPVVADLRDDRGPPPEARAGDRDIRGAAAERLRERADLGQGHADLLWIEVNADPSHRDDLGARHSSSRTPRFERSRGAARVRDQRRASRPVRERTSLRSPLLADARARP